MAEAPDENYDDLGFDKARRTTQSLSNFLSSPVLHNFPFICSHFARPGGRVDDPPAAGSEPLVNAPDRIAESSILASSTCTAPR